MYLGSTYCLDLDKHVKESCADFFRVIMKAVLESGQEFFQEWMAESVVQDDSQTLGKAQTTSHLISRLQPITQTVLSAVTIISLILAQKKERNATLLICLHLISWV